MHDDSVLQASKSVLPNSIGPRRESSSDNIASDNNFSLEVNKTKMNTNFHNLEDCVSLLTVLGC